MHRTLTAIAAATWVAACASLAFASTATVTLKDKKGDGDKGSVDIRSASVSYNGTTVKHTIRAAKARDRAAARSPTRSSRRS
jgi:hypothetical protein